MASSGTYAFNPAFSDVILAAYARIQLRRPALTTEHFIDAGNEGNFLMSEWSSEQPLLWKSELIPQALTQGVATYTLPNRVVMILLTYIEIGSGTSATDRVIGPLSTTEYASLPNKTIQAPPTAFWFDRQIIPQITFWQVPDGGGPYTAQMRCVSQVQDVTTPGGATLDIPYRALDAFVAGLAYRLARIHAPQLEQQRKMDSMEAWNKFSGNDTENVAMYFTPLMRGYYR
jgi:hypothetical protein